MSANRVDFEKVVFIAGASSGIGKACGDYLKDKGYRVYGGARRITAEMEGGTGEPGLEGGFRKWLHLDVRDEGSVNAAVQKVMEAEGGLGIVISAAGYGLAGAVEDTSPDEALAQFETNFLGPLRVFRAVLPVMRRQRGGRLVVVTSVAGFIPLPFQSMYSASKYALEGMTESLRMEVAPFGIKVSMVEPGDISTGFTSARAWTRAAEVESSPYRKRCAQAVAAMAKSELGGPGPQIVVKDVVRLLRMKNPPARVITGLSYKMVGLLKRIVPDSFLEYVLVKMYS